MDVGRFALRAKTKIAIGVLGAVLAAGGVMVVVGGPVTAAAGDPTFETPTGNPGTHGSVGFFNSAGVQVYGGAMSDDPIAAYFQAQGGPSNGGKIGALDHIATAYTYTPQKSTPADQWTTPDQLTGGDEFGTAADTASLPGALKNTTKAVAIGLSGGTSFNDAIATFPLADTDDPNIVQVRITTSSDSSVYYSTDIKITGTTWTQVFPAAPNLSAVSTALSAASANPASPAAHGASVTLTSTLTATDSTHPAGTVQLFDGATAVGAAATFNATTGAVSQTVTPADGAHNYKFTFTPTDIAGYNGTSSTVLAYTITAVTATTTTLAVTPASPSIVGDPVTLTATVAPASAVGTVQFLDGSAPIGAAVPVSAGSAATTVSNLSQATHSLTAKFTPTDAAVFATSTSTASSYTVDPVPGATTATTLTVTSASPVLQGVSVTLNAAVSNGGVGTVDFYNGTTKLNPTGVTVSAGTASYLTTTLPVGTLSLSAKFVPTDLTLFGASSSAAVPFIVKAPPVTTTLTLTSTPASPVFAGSPIVLNAALSATAAAGTVQFFDGAVPLGTPVTVVNGVASLPTTLADVASHPITATFTSADTTAFTNATATALNIAVIAPPTVTSTTLAVAPASGVAFGTSVTMTAAVPTVGAAGSVQFKDGTKVLGSANLTAGSATLATAALGSGSHSLTATFQPTDPTAFAPSSSAPITFVVQAQATATTLTVTPDDEVSAGSSVSLKATVTPAAAVGSVQFLNGTASLGSVALKAGQATLATTDLVPGDAALTARFVPTSTALYATSTSTPVALTVKEAASIGDTIVNGVVLTPGTTLKPGADVSLAGAGFIPGESISVVLRSTPVVLKTAIADSTGTVSVTVKLPANLAPGRHTLTLQGALDAPSFSFVIAGASATSPASGTTTPAAAGTGSTPIADPTAATSGGGLLASTGAKVIPAALLGLLLVGGGLALASTGRRRRSH